MSDTTAPYRKLDALVAIDWDDNADLTKLLDALTGVVVNVHVDARSVERPNRAPADRYVITFDATRMRPAHAHAYGYDAGFLVHLDSALAKVSA
jgi:hypothetical protein